jgi:SNF2 family DNA or RNA helicase
LKTPIPYEEFLTSKIKVAEKIGIKVEESRLHPDSKDHQKAIALWALELGRALIAPDCGTGKTNISLDVLTILQKEFGGKCLVVTELGAHDTYCSTDPEVGEGARMGIPVLFARTTEELISLSSDIVCTNYESVRLGKIDFSAFTAVWLDEGNYIKNMASETTDALKQQLVKVKWKYIASATPSPNETLELINYAHVLGIADRGQILTRFFQRNSTKAGDLTLHPQHEADFWLWVHTWMVAIEKPSDLGFSDEGYNLPEFTGLK